MEVYSVSLKGQKTSVWSMLYLGVMGLLFVAGFGGNELPTQAQSSTAPTVINIGTTVKTPNVKRLGMNISGQQYWDSGQMLRDLTFNNPGFEAEQWNSVLTCSAVSGTTCTDGNGWSQWGPNFLQGATFEFIYGSAKGQTGTIVSMTGSGATPSSAGAGAWYNFGTTTPAVGDVFIVRKNFPGSPDVGWWPSTGGGATITADTTDLSPNTPGKQAVSLNASGSGQSASETSYFDGENGKNFILLNGTYTITFRAKSLAGSNQLNVSAGRVGSSYFNQNIALTNSWQDYSYTFTANETGPSTNSGFLGFTVSGGQVLLDDAALTENANANNPTAFRNAVVERLQQLNPGVLRYMDSGIDYGSSIDNMIAVPDARVRAGSLQKWNNTTNPQTMVPLGLEEFLVLCQTVGAEPWFTVPMNIDPADMQNLIEFLAGSSGTTYGAKRAALGQSAPWTSVFPVIHLEIGNEMWNFGFLGEMMPSSNAYGSRGGAIFAAAKTAPDFSSSSFDLILDGQAVNPSGVGQQVLSSAGGNFDSIDAAPYTFNTLVDYSSNEAIFGSMFAEPEGVDSQPTGYMYQQMQMAAGQQSSISGNAAKVAVYEVSLSTLGGTAPQSVVNAVVPSLGAGLSIADHMLLMMRDDGIVTQNLFALPGYEGGFNNSNGGSEVVQLWGTVIDMGGPTNCNRPYFLAEQLANTAIGGNLLATTQTGSNPTWNVNSTNGWGIDVNGAHYIQSFAFANGTENSLVLFNLSRTTALPVTFTGANAPTGLVQVGLLTSANITDNNETSNTVQIQNSTIQNFNSLGLTTLPPYSMTVYRWSSSGGVGTSQPSATTTTLTATPTSATVGQTVTLTAAVTPASGSTPTGNVAFMNGGTSLGTTALSNGQVTLNVSTLTAGTHTLTATYQGSANDGGSTSSAVTVTVAAAALPTTTTTVQAPSQVTDGQSATLTATVAASSGSTPTGTVTFSAGSTVLGTASLSGGKATYTVSPVSLAAGTYNVTASYAGNSSDTGSTSAAASMKVVGAVVSTTTTIQAPAQVTDGSSATLTAAVAASSGSTPTGTVTFLAGSTVLGTATLSAGNAAYTISPVNLPVGTYTVTASYAGTSSDSASTSSAATVKVVAAALPTTTTTVTAPAQVTDGQSATLTAGVAASSGATPTGTVTFSAGSTVLGTASLSGGKATYTVSPVSLAAGTYNVTASYAGNSSDTGSTSAAASMKVVGAVVSTTTTIQAPAQVTDGSSATLTAAVAASSGSTPTGTVTFLAGSTVLGTATLSGGNAAYTISPVNLPVGTYTVTASYAGTSSDSASTSSAATVKVVAAMEATTTTVQAPAEATDGSSATLTAAVTAAAGAAPTGTVTFTVGQTVVGTATLSGGKATYTMSPVSLAAGTYSVTATYAGSSTDSASTSAKGTIVIEGAVESTTTTLALSSTQVQVGQSMSATVKVKASAGSTPTGTVNFYVDSTLVGSTQLSGGTAVFTTNADLAPGTYTASVNYAGTSTDSASSSAKINFTVVATTVATTTTLSSSTNKTAEGNPIVLTAAVSPQTKGANVAGTVTFYLGNTVLGTGQLAGGQAVLNVTSKIAPGNYQLYAVYSGNSTDLTSTSNTITLEITPDAVATSTKLSAAATQLAAGATTVLTANVTANGSSSAPTGTVAFFIGQTQIGSATLAGGAAQYNFVANLAAGTYQLTATYTGTSQDSASSSAPLTITIAPSVAATTTSLTSSASQVKQGQAFSLTAVVTPTSGKTVASGSVSFYVGQTQIGTAVLTSGTATLNVNNTFAAGSYQLTAVYGGNATDGRSTSAPIDLTIGLNEVATTTTLKASASQITQGQAFGLTAVVAPATGTTTPQGTVSFYLGGTLIGTATLSSGQATFNASNTFAAGSYQLTAVYAGNASDSGSSSAPVALTIESNQVATTTSLLASASQVAQGQGFGLTAVVTPTSGSTSPQGSVSFYLGQTVIGIATLNGGQATLNAANTFAPGTYQLTAVYAGNTNDSGSSSAPVTLTISQGITAPTPIATATLLTSSAPQVAEGVTFSLTAIVAPTSGSGAPQGTVNFYLGGTQIGSATLTNGTAIFSAVNSFAPGTYQVTAVYSGSAQDSASASNPVSLTVPSPSSPGTPVPPTQQPLPTTTSLSVNPQQATAGQTIAMQVQISASGSTSAVSGAVTLYMGQTAIGTVNVSGGTAVMNVQAPAAGTYTVMAAFAAQNGYLGSQSAPVTFTVQASSAVTPVLPPAPAGTFTIGLSTNTVKMNPTQSASLQVLLAAVQGYNGTVQLSCAGLPAGYSCSFAPATVAIAGANATSTLSLSAPVNTAQNSPIMTNVARVMVLPWDIFGLFGCVFGRGRRGGRWTKLAVLCIVALAATLSMTGCGLTVNNVTQPYDVTVTAVSQNQAPQTTTFTLYVTQPAAIF